MIRLITGTPGAGKTLYAISKLLTKYRDEGRPIFVLGVPGLQIPHELMPPIDQWTKEEMVHGWEYPTDPTLFEKSGMTIAHKYAFPENSVIVIDEAQNVFRPRASTTKIPPYVAALETHRHTGIDFLLITQHPSRIDNSVRTLVGSHIHIRRVWGWKRAIVYEWDHCSDPSRISTATKSTWPYDRKAFALYKSAEVHTSRGQRPPALLWILGVLFLTLIVGTYAGYRHLTGKAAVASDNPVAPGRSINTGAGSVAPAPALDMPPAARFIPRYPEEPMSAPAYDGLQRVVEAPRVTLCIASSTRCQCYSQQSTRLDVPDSFCRAYAAGERFDPYRPTQVDPLSRQQPQQVDRQPPPQETPSTPATWS